MREIKIIGSTKFGYFVYEIGKSEAMLKVVYTNFGFNCYEMNGHYFGNFSSIENLQNNLDIYYNN